MLVSVQAKDFDAGSVIQALHAERKDIGAIASFIGLVRDFESGGLISMTLEHYPGMTEKALTDIAEQAEQRWQLQGISIIHRYGELKPSEQIVMVAVASSHRGEAFQACEFIMDYLKTGAPFWKKEKADNSTGWVEAKTSDDHARDRWSKD